MKIKTENKWKYLSKSGGLIVFVVSITPFFFEKTIVDIIAKTAIVLWFMSCLFLVLTLINVNKQKRTNEVIKEKDKLLNEIAYKLRLSVKKRITEKLWIKYPNADWQYEKEEHFLVFLYGGEIYIKVWIRGEEIKAKVFISNVQDIFIEMPEKSELSSEFNDIKKDKKVSEDVDKEEYEEEVKDPLEKENDIEIMDLYEWINNEGSYQIYNIFSENRITEFYVDSNGKVFDDKKQFGIIEDFPAITKWDELIYHLNEMEIKTEIVNENMKIYIENR